MSAPLLDIYVNHWTESWEIGEKKGIEIGKLKTLIGLVKKNLLSITSAATSASSPDSTVFIRFLISSVISNASNIATLH